MKTAVMLTDNERDALAQLCNVMWRTFIATDDDTPPPTEEEFTEIVEVEEVFCGMDWDKLRDKLLAPVTV